MIRPASSAGDFASAGLLIREYIDWLPFDLDFQDFESELAERTTTRRRQERCSLDTSPALRSPSASSVCVASKKGSPSSSACT